MLQAAVQDQKRAAGSRAYNSGAGFKQEAPLKESLIGGTGSKGSIPNVDSCKKIEAEALQVKSKIMKQPVALNPNINLECMGRIWHNY